MQVQSVASLNGSGSGIAVSYSVGFRRGWDPSLLWQWLWCRLAAIGPIQPLAWELPYAMAVALKKQNKTKKKTKKQNNGENLIKKKHKLSGNIYAYHDKSSCINIDKLFYLIS